MAGISRFEARKHPRIGQAQKAEQRPAGLKTWTFFRWGRARPGSLSRIFSCPRAEIGIRRKRVRPARSCGGRENRSLQRRNLTGRTPATPGCASRSDRVSRCRAIAKSKAIFFRCGRAGDEPPPQRICCRPRRRQMQVKSLGKLHGPAKDGVGWAGVEPGTAENRIAWGQRAGVGQMKTVIVIGGRDSRRIRNDRQRSEVCSRAGETGWTLARAPVFQAQRQPRRNADAALPSTATDLPRKASKIDPFPNVCA